MSSWNVTPTMGTTQHTSVNLSKVSSITVTEGKAAAEFVKTVTVFGVFTILISMSIIVIVVSLAVTHTGPFATSASTFSSVSSTASSAGSSTVSSGTTASTTVASTIAVSPQCSSHTTINDATRLQTAGIGSTACDTSLFSLSVGTWVRFNGAGGTQLATSAPGVNHCGTQASGWYSGSLPASGATVNGTVCFQWSSNTCNWNSEIRVTNCGSFYVYDLIAPPACNLRYCTQ